ncbi:MAG: glycosyltransferase, partial [Chloroflexota bacterium]|nr:glycosyltransferase [Chloroflexota bacterium]
PYLADGRIRYHRLDENRGLGAALNYGLSRARAELVAYLPSDDVYFSDHLASLADCLAHAAGATLAYSGLRYSDSAYRSKEANGRIESEDCWYPLQLVQVMHRRTDDRWIEREALTTDDLERMLWSRLAPPDLPERRVGTGRVSCEWVGHPRQRHRVVREDLEDDTNPQLTAGLNPYRSRYRVTQPLRFHSTVGNLYDEVELYRRFRQRPDTPAAPDGLKIVLVGELAFNPERVLALEERGHTLYGLWTPHPGSSNTVGPLPFGHVEEVPREGWRDTLRRLRPDVIYALLNWRAVPFAHQVLVENVSTANPGVPFIWHLKEGPRHCLQHGMWRELVDLQTRSDGQIYSSPEMREWFHGELPETRQGLALVLDGDLPKRERLDVPRTPRLSAADGEVHTVLAGRPLGLDPPFIAQLARHGVHLHVYGELQGPWAPWLREVQDVAPGYLHQHPMIHQDQWVSELSRYDAGWLHVFQSANGGELRRATWDDLNYPARIATYVAAGLPLIQRDNAGAIFATQTLARERHLGLFYNDAQQLAEQLRDQARMGRLWDSVWRQREQFTFDYYADDLVAFFRRVIRSRA